MSQVHPVSQPAFQLRGFTEGYSEGSRYQVLYRTVSPSVAILAQAVLVEDSINSSQASVHRPTLLAWRTKLSQISLLKLA